MTSLLDHYEHTPGPWMIFNGGDIGSAAVRRPETIVVKAGAVKGVTIGQAMKNARLIAAAPELLEACQDAANQLRTIAALLNHIPKRYAAQISPTIRYGDIDAIIAKAEAHR